MSAELPGFETGLRLRGGVEPAAENPVAAVLLETPVPHLARTFDYGVPESFSAHAQPGVRVRVKFSGRKLTGFITERKADTDHSGDLEPLAAVVSPLPVLTKELLALCEELANKFAGSTPDVVRLAIPPRQAQAEAAVLAAEVPAQSRALPAMPAPLGPAEEKYLQDLGTWARQPGGRHGPRAGYCVPAGTAPGHAWAHAALRAADTVLRAGLSVLIVVPDGRDVATLKELAGDVATELTHEQGPRERWSAWVAALTGRARLVVGTRASAYVPLVNPGLIVMCFDDADAFIEPRAPYCHARHVVLQRAAQSSVATLMVDRVRSVEVQRLIDAGWMGDIRLDRARVRQLSPIVLDAGFERGIEDLSALPSRAFAFIRQALGRENTTGETGPVLVQVPRTGYVTALTCQDCNELLRCTCGAPLRAASLTGPFACPACGFTGETARCAACNSTRFTSVATGLDGVHHLLGRAFPGFPVVRSGGDHIVETVGAEPHIVVATTGAEPYAPGGYALALLFDTLWPGPSLRSTQKALARRMRAVNLVRPNPGRVLVLDDNPDVVRTLIHADPVGWAAHELQVRYELAMPPTVRVCEISGPRAVVNATVRTVVDTPGVRIFEEREGPPRSHYTRASTENGSVITAVLGISWDAAPAVVHTLHQAVTSAVLHGAQAPRVRLDDPDAL